MKWSASFARALNELQGLSQAIDFVADILLENYPALKSIDKNDSEIGATVNFDSERVSDEDTLSTINAIFSVKTPAGTSGSVNGTEGTTNKGGYILDPHSAVGVAASQRSINKSSSDDAHYVSLATAHPAKFSSAVEQALKDHKDFQFNDLLPTQFQGLDKMEKRVTYAKKSEGFQGVRSFIGTKVPATSIEAN